MQKLLVFTDLDGTLLDHATYDYAPALPAIACPPNTPGHSGATAAPTLHVLAAAYAEIRTTVLRLRQNKGYRFRGFGDLTAAAIADLTGLSQAAAAAAQQRTGSEPLLWEDTEAARQEFMAQVAAHGLQVTQGGRFLHVMGRTDKGAGVRWLADQYRQAFPAINWQVVALGDSPNDLPMLQAADVGVLIANPHRPPFPVAGVKRLLQPDAPGPTGWAQAIAQLLQGLDSAN
jgi:mannosyl-3-phosphoglycerate phosphatase